jgi:glucosamine kinase
MTGLQLGLGLDAGGTQTRWALAQASGQLVAEGSVAPLSGLLLGSDAGRATMRATLAEIAQHLPSQARLVGVLAGITGFDTSDVPPLREMVGQALAVPTAAVQAMSDIELACHAAFAPGAGYVLYAGTGSVAAFVDSAGVMHRAGGRGPVIDDGGGGYWIARQALRCVWRAEDEVPGSWQTSPLAQSLFKRLGGSDWAATRKGVYAASRGEVGTLALAVAEAADADPAAMALLQEAGHELARLGQALLRRFGPRPIALAGRALDLHPIIEATLRAALPEGTPVQRLTQRAHHAAASIAARKSL